MTESTGLHSFPEPRFSPEAPAYDHTAPAGLPGSPPDPRVSILMVAKNAADHIGEALHSARRQTFRHIEIIVVDDGSTDATAHIARRHAAADHRVRIVAGPQSGLAAVRNTSLHAARGRYGAILDSDDILHPRHVELLFSLATRHRASIAAMNMVSFWCYNGRSAQVFLRGRSWSGRERQLPAEEFIEAGRLDGAGPSLGYLKPLFDLRFLRGHGISYDTNLRIGEDYDLVDRAMRAGASYVVGPSTTYFYRRHENSTSHRFKRSDLSALLESERTKARESAAPVLQPALRRRRRSVERALAHFDAVEALKARRLRETAGKVRQHPRIAYMLAVSAFEGLALRAGKLLGRRKIDHGQSAKCRILLVGRPRSSSPLARAVRVLERQGCAIRREPVTEPSKARRRLCRKGPFDAIFIADRSALPLAPYALSPTAPVIGEENCDPALVDIVLTRSGGGRLIRRDRHETDLRIDKAIARFHESSLSVSRPSCASVPA